MILYFTGTGNSKYIAEQIAQKTGDEILSLNLLLKQRKKDILQSKSQSFVFVCPTYAWRIPRVVTELIRKTHFEGSTNVYFILSCGSETANAIHHIRKICHNKGWSLQGVAEIKMPSNYIAMFPALDKAAAKAIVEDAEAVINQVAEDINHGNNFYVYTAKGIFGKLMSGCVNTLFYPLFIHAKGFSVTDQCTSCGACMKLCPLNNILINNRRPVWSNYCTHCMACINGCPAKAIEYKNKTQGKQRYWFTKD